MYTQPYLSVSNTTSQNIASAGTPQVVTFNNTFKAIKIVGTSSSRFTFNEAGTYLVGTNFQLVSGVANKVHDLWIRIDGTDVTNSNTKNSIVNANDRKDIYHQFVITVTAGQYIEIWMNGDDTAIGLAAFAAGVTPTRPLSESINLYIKKVSN